MAVPEPQGHRSELRMVARLPEQARRQGFTWSDVRMTPAALTRLVLAGYLDVVSSQGGRNTYRLTQLGARRIAGLDAPSSITGQEID